MSSSTANMEKVAKEPAGKMTQAADPGRGLKSKKDFLVITIPTDPLYILSKGSPIPGISQAP